MGDVGRDQRPRHEPEYQSRSYAKRPRLQKPLRQTQEITGLQARNIKKYPEVLRSKKLETYYPYSRYLQEVFGGKTLQGRGCERARRALPGDGSLGKEGLCVLRREGI